MKKIILLAGLFIASLGVFAGQYSLESSSSNPGYQDLKTYTTPITFCNQSVTLLVMVEGRGDKVGSFAHISYQCCPSNRIVSQSCTNVEPWVYDQKTITANGKFVMTTSATIASYGSTSYGLAQAKAFIYY